MDTRQRSAVTGLVGPAPATATAEADSASYDHNTIQSMVCQESRTLKIKFHPDLAIETLRQKRDREFRLWTLARALDLAGVGRLRLADFQDSLTDLDIKGASPGTVRRLLAAGHETFWERYTNHHTSERWIALYGLLPVCVALGVRKLKISPVCIPLALIRTMKRFREAIAASRFYGGAGG